MDEQHTATGNAYSSYVDALLSCNSGCLRKQLLQDQLLYPHPDSNLFDTFGKQKELKDSCLFDTIIIET